ncbi:MaoC family dehydratase [Candidatus Poribacteria bacterium]|nr:MaoC family dehydratase [Candidatus Poribacteria bacterium]
MSRQDFEKFFKTEKQRQFDTDFFKEAENYEAWDEIDFESGEEILGEQTFTIKAEDMKFFAEAVLDDNPLMNDEGFAEKSLYGTLVPHPLFITPIGFWCIGVRGRGNWVRTPGARNPGQDIEVYEQFRVGETIHIKARPHDRYIKRGKYYLQYKADFYNQDNVKKATWIATLILPKTKADIREFLKGRRGVEI